MSLTPRLPTVALLLIAGAVGIYAAARAGGAAAGLLAAAAVGCAMGLVLRSQPSEIEVPAAGVLFDRALLFLPAALTVYLSFDSGGFFPSAPAVAAILLVVALVLRVTLADRPFAGFSRPLAVAAGALGLYALWILLSATWSDAPARSLIEFDRALVYLLALALFGSIPRSAERLRWMAGGLALGIVVVSLAALATRFFPETFPTAPNIGDQQLSYPLSYSNTLGILAVIGAVLCLYFATSLRESLVTRAAASAALPVLATTVYLTLSRGPVAAACVGVAAFLLLGRPRGALPGLLATLPPSVIAVVSAYRHELLTEKDPPIQAAMAQGEEVAAVLALCAAGAAILRVLLAPLDSRLGRFSLPSHLRRPVVAGAWAASALVLVVVALATGAPGAVSDQYDRFVETAQAGPDADIRASLFDPSNRGLIDNWDVALQAFRDEPLHGQGAGAYEVYWLQERPADQAGYPVTDAHSLYVEVLGELGLVGFLLLLTVLVAIFASFAPWRRGRERGLYAALFAAGLAWAAHAGVEWDWEMPAVTLWLFAFGGACLASREAVSSRAHPSQGVRVAVGLLLMVAALTPGFVLASQRQLEEGVEAFYAGDCSKAIDGASASISTLEIRPEPYEVIAACQARRGNNRLAIEAMTRAVERDPRNWRYHYDLASVRGSAGQDPRPDLLQAKRLNPYQADVAALLDTIETGTVVDWEPTLEPARPGNSPVPR